MPCTPLLIGGDPLFSLCKLLCTPTQGVAEAALRSPNRGPRLANRMI